MNFIQAEAEIRKFFEDAWLAATPIAWPDLKFAIPNRQNWVRFDCVENDGEQVSMGSPGSNRFRHYGIVTIQVFAPQDQGSIEARQLATNALGVFMGAVTTNDIHFYDVQGRQIGNDGNGFYQINVVSSFYYDEIT